MSESSKSAVALEVTYLVNQECSNVLHCPWLLFTGANYHGLLAVTT